MHGPDFVTDLALVLGVAALTSVVARALRQATVLGYLFAGLLVGPYLPLPIYADPERVGAMAEFGVVLVMFAVGLEFRLAKLLRVLPVSGFTALIQIGFLAWCGESVGRALGWDGVEAAFLGASIAISSTMVVTRVFEEVEVDRDVRNHVLGALIVQDVVAIVLIATMTAVAAGGGLGPRELAATLGRLGAVLVALLVASLLVVPRLLRIVLVQRSKEILAVVAVGLSFSLALLAKQLGYSVALGGFLAGVVVAEARAARPIESVLQPLRDVFAAVFFVSIGMSVQPRVALENLPAILAVTGIVVAGQFMSVTVAGGLSGLGLRRSLSAGLALGQIGEFAFIIAAIGISAGVVRPELQAILVGVAVLTAFTTPLLIQRSAAVVRAVDRRLPSRVQHLLAANESWFAGMRSRARSEPLERRALRALILDAAVLLLLLAGISAWLPDVAAWAGERFGLSRRAATAIAVGGAAVTTLPLLAGLGRNTAVLARHAGQAASESDAATLAAHTARLSVALGVLLGVGVPAVAILRPRLPGGIGLAFLTTIALGVLFVVLRNTGRLAAEVRSGAGELAELLASQTRTEVSGAPRRVDKPGEARGGGGALFPGLETGQSAPLEIGSLAVDRALRDVDLRSRTGATAIAILRGSERILLPGGRAQLEAGDVLALVGSRDALARAVALLAEPAEPEETDEAPENGASEDAAPFSGDDTAPPPPAGSA